VTVPPDVVGLPDEQVRIVQARDRAVVVEERRDPGEVLGLAMGLEPELVLDVGLAVAVVVDVDLVANGRVERKKFGPPAGSWSGTKLAMMVRLFVASGLTNAYRSVLSAAGSPAMSGASRWLDARTPETDVTAMRRAPATPTTLDRVDKSISPC